MLLNRGQNCVGFLRVADHLPPLESVQDAAGDLVFLQHHGDGLRRVYARRTLAAALRVGGQRLFELVGQPKVIDH